MIANRFRFRAYDSHPNFLRMSYFDADKCDPSAILECMRPTSSKLMQSTGTVDKIGREIFEGDFVKVYNWGGSHFEPRGPREQDVDIWVVKICVVEWDGAALVMKKVQEYVVRTIGYDDDRAYMIDAINSNGLVLGNIFESPGLVHATKEAK